ncbi:four helix bundle protein [bacterium]|jgi:four helix bundle protein|nr:four helix bundle protein [bacterium]
MYTYSFEKLDFWTDLRLFISDIYKATNKYPKSENYCLIDQIRRAVISVSSNLAEGSSRTSFKDQAHFYQIAFSSLMEVLSQLIVSHDLNYITDDEYFSLRKRIDFIASRLSLLRKDRLNLK